MDTKPNLDRMFQPPVYSISDYQRDAMRTRGKYEHKDEQLKCAGLGLSGEAGEVAELIKKKLFHLKPVNDQDIAKELGDVLWYVALAADCIGWDLELIATMNIEKLKKRYPEGFSYQASHERVDCRDS